MSVTLAGTAKGIMKGFGRSFSAISTTTFVICWTILRILAYFSGSLESGYRADQEDQNDKSDPIAEAEPQFCSPGRRKKVIC